VLRALDDEGPPLSRETIGFDAYLAMPASDNGSTGPVPIGFTINYFGTLRNSGPHGGPFIYRSVLIDVLAWVIERAAGERLHELIARELWQPMGAEFDAEITVDRRGNPMADGGICATLRDMARFGQLFLRRGMAGRRRVVPAWWIDDILRGAADGPQAFAQGDGATRYAANSHYRNCWWVRDPGEPFYYASGINGQHGWPSAALRPT